MAGAAVEITIDDDAVVAGLDRLRAAGDDLTPVMDAIGGYVLQSTQRRFELGVGPGGTPWLPSRRAIEQSGRTLVDTARLLQSLTWRADRDSVEVGTNVVYAAIHQFGGPTGRGHAVDMPARPFLGIDDDDADRIAAIVRDAVEGAWSAPQ